MAKMKILAVIVSIIAVLDVNCNDLPNGSEDHDSAFGLVIGVDSKDQDRPLNKVNVDGEDGPQSIVFPVGDKQLNEEKNEPKGSKFQSTQDLCSEMHGECVDPREKCSHWQAMRIFIWSLPNITKKYCAISAPHRRPACCAPSGQVFTVDIENGLAFIFDNTLIYNTWEPPNTTTTRVLVDYTDPLVRGNLIVFLVILNKYLKAPNHIHDHTKKFISAVGDYVQRHSTFTAKELQRKFIELQSKGAAFLSAWQPSVSCHNINPIDCYANAWIASCGFWNMFHTMTVSAAEANAAHPLEVIYAIRGFMHNFFFCFECRHHFLGIYEQTIDTYGDNTVNTTDKAILWLWCTHNTVNQAWRQEPDNYWPPHPTFPPPLACPDCWTESPGAEYTNCPKLFCQGNQGPDDCFRAQSVVHKDPFQRIYYNFSMPDVLTYLKHVYSVSSPLNPDPINKKLIINDNIKCPR
ncbi:unnamed protein product [Meganyctiphanes norvegica]|uniref:Sulfhydryl oxidase n=1 Tax=Meganyctiphanes norvegica TaxID=48144 RepID=A0AAV2QY38_MEGNR